MLESEAVEWLFKRLIARYGASWHAKWDGVPSVDLKADWGRALAGVTKHQVQFALDLLPITFPPNAAEFRALCRAAPEPAKPVLPSAKPTPEQAEASKKIREEALAKLAGLKLDSSPDKAKATFEDFKARLQAGERLDQCQRDWFRAVAHRFAAAPAEMPTDFKPIAPELMPASMRPDARVFEAPPCDEA